MILNAKQQEAFDEVLYGDNRIVAILGKAGSGKTTVVSQICKAYKGDILVSATTHKAKSILEKLLGFTCYTTHSIAGFNLIRNGLDEYFSPVREPVTSDLLVIDEFSMLTENVLKVLLNGSYKKIVLVGDEAQLPAIGIKAKIPLEAKIITLSQNMRQGENEELREYLEGLREHIASKRMFSLSKAKPISYIKLYDSHKEFCNAYNNCSNAKRILAYSNRVVDSYNLNINNKVKYQIGDLLVLDKPIGSLRNGDTVEITDFTEYDDRYEINIYHSDKMELANITVFKTKSAEEKYLNYFIEIKDIEEYWKQKELILHPKHIYATTIHKAQGITIDEVFIDVRDIYAQLFRKPSRYNNYNKPISIDEYLKLLYVAISRMRYKAHLFIGEKRDYKYLKKGE